MTRINKFLAECGVASRRGAEDLIRAGRVKVNGEVVTDLSFQVGIASPEARNDVVEVDGKRVARQPEKVYILLNKPTGVVTTCSDQFGRKTVLDVILSGTGECRMQNAKCRINSALCTQQSALDRHVRLFPVGRLDYATEGLLILTNDGEFARKVTHPSSEIPKTYVATLNKAINAQQLNQLRRGVKIDAGPFAIAASLALPRNDTVEITITEGRNRQVRKMLEAVGLRVTHLKRISIGNLTIGDLKVGEWRYLTDKEITCFFKKLIIS